MIPFYSQEEYDDSMDEEMVNPNLYVTLPESDHSGYILLESGGLLFLETGPDNVLMT